MQSLSKFQWNFSRNRANNPKMYTEPQLTLKAIAILRKKSKLETTQYLVSNYITKAIIMKAVWY